MPSNRRLASYVTSAALAAGLSCRQPDRVARRRARGPILTVQTRRSAVTIALAVGTARYDFTGQGVCLEIPDGSIFDAPASLYSARHTS